MARSNQVNPLFKPLAQKTNFAGERAQKIVEAKPLPVFDQAQDELDNLQNIDIGGPDKLLSSTSQISGTSQARRK